MRTAKIGDFAGLNTDDSKFALLPEQATNATNVVIDEGSIKPRPFLDQVGISTNIITNIYPLYIAQSSIPILIFGDVNCAAILTVGTNWTRLDSPSSSSSLGQYNISGGMNNIFGNTPTLNGTPTLGDQVSANSIVNGAFDGVDDYIDSNVNAVTAADKFVADCIIDDSTTSGPVFCGVAGTTHFFNVSVDASNLPASIDVTFSGEQNGTPFTNTSTVSGTTIEGYATGDFPHLGLRVDCDNKAFRLVVNGVLTYSVTLSSFNDTLPIDFYAGRNYDGSSYSYGTFKYDYFAISETDSLVDGETDRNTPRGFINGQFNDISGSLCIPLKNDVVITSPTNSYINIDSQTYIATDTTPAKVVYILDGGFDIIAVPFGLPTPGQPQVNLVGNSGTFEFYTTFIDIFGNESPISPAGNNTRGPGQITFSAINAPADYVDVIDKIRVYARNTSTQAFAYFIHEQSFSGGSVTVNIPSFAATDQALTVQAPQVTELQLDGFKHIALYRDRVYAADVTIGSDSFRNRVYFSAVNNKERFNEFNYFVVGNSNEPITGMVTFKDLLIIFKNTEIYYAANDPLTNSFLVRKINPRIGCVASRTIKVLDNTLYWRSVSGVYAMLDISNPLRLSSEISDELVLPKNPDVYLENAHAEIDQNNKRYLLSEGWNGSKNTKTLVFHVDEFLRSGKPTWTKWNFGFRAGCLWGAGAQQDRTLLCQTNTVYAFSNEPTPAETNISWEWETGFFNSFNPGSYQRLQYATMLVQHNADGDSFSFEYRVNLDNVAYTGRNFTANDNQSHYKIRLGTRSEFVQFKMSGTATDNFKVFGFMLQGNRSGRR